jgi:hypothetical protein
LIKLSVYQRTLQRLFWGEYKELPDHEKRQFILGMYHRFHAPIEWIGGSLGAPGFWMRKEQARLQLKLPNREMTAAEKADWKEFLASRPTPPLPATPLLPLPPVLSPAPLPELPVGLVPPVPLATLLPPPELPPAIPPWPPPSLDG